MEIKRGIPVSAGVAIGPALVVDTEGFRIPQRYVEKKQRREEINRLHAALEAAGKEARANEKVVADKLGKQYAAIFAAHAVFMKDLELIKEIEFLIRDQNYAAEYAVSRVMRRHVKALENLDQGHFSTRAADLIDIEKAILTHLLGGKREPLQHLTQPVVVLAHDLTPSQTASMDREKVLAFATEAGGRTSHTAIMAGVLEIPAVVGLGKFLGDVSGGDEVIVDGNRGVLILNPDEETRERHEQARKTFSSFEHELEGLRELPAATKDKDHAVRVQLCANIEFPEEARHCLERGAEGVGLYRTEFLYLNRTSDPTEDEHLEAYLTVLRTLGSDRPVVIRT